jgi:GNAT superfamily N-acetyltransferase
MVYKQMRITRTKHLTPVQEEQINELWNLEFPVRLKDRFRLLLEGVDHYHHYLIEDTGQKVIAWAVDFEKDKEIRFSVIVDPEFKGKGLGKSLVNHLKTENEEFYGWVIDHNEDLKSNGEHYLSPMAFYVKNGFEILHDQRIESDMLRAVKIKWKHSPAGNPPK